jgi:hypothetical protein
MTDTAERHGVTLGMLVPEPAARLGEVRQAGLERPVAIDIHRQWMSEVDLLQPIEGGCEVIRQHEVIVAQITDVTRGCLAENLMTDRLRPARALGTVDETNPRVIQQRSYRCPHVGSRAIADNHELQGPHRLFQHAPAS